MIIFPPAGRAAGRGSAEGDFQLKTCSSSFIQFEKPCIDCRTACIVVRLAARQHFISKYCSLGKCDINPRQRLPISPLLHLLSTSGPNCCRALISIGKNTCYWTSPSSCYVKQPPIYTSTLIDRYIFCLRIHDITNEIFPDSRFLPQWTRCLTTSLMLLGPMTVRARVTPARL